MVLKKLFNRRIRYKLLVGIVLFTIATIFQIIFFPPDYIIHILQLNIPILYTFMLSLFFMIYFIGVLTLGNRKHSLLISLFVVVYLIFRLNNLKDLFFLILLIALFLAAEFFFTGQKNRFPRRTDKIKS